MSLTPGTQFGPYRIEGPLGAGGMGEVYRATDTRLGRVVALKVLPSHLSDRPDLKERFDREAKAISSLNHSHICALYDVGHENGVDYIVMEHLEGETLADRLARGALPLDQMLALGSQIAQALHAAHRAGVVHRDLKPGNIMLTRSGVKLLDFGLAKMGTAGAKPQSGSLPGMTAAMTEPGSDEPLTREGTLLGTFQYMSPEQLEGKDADARSDLFALGSVLYEMATGQKAFAGDSQASLIAAIMSKEPRSMGDFARMTPAALDRVVRACLVKDPESRVQSAHDVALQLDWIATAGPEAGGAIVAPRRSRWLPVLALGWVAALVLVALVLFRNDPEPPPGVRAAILGPRTLGLASEPCEIALSPDGTRVVYPGMDSLGVRRLYLRELNGTDTETLPGTERAALPFWSPDGQHVGFFVPDRMKRISVTGQRVVQTISDATSGRGGAWGPDGTIVFSPASSSPLFRVSATGGTPEPFTVLDSTQEESGHRFPRFLSDGKHLVYVSVPGLPHRVQLVSLDDPTPTTLLEADGGAEAGQDDYLLFGRQGTLFAQKLDLGQKRMVGDPIPLPDRPGGTRGYEGTPALAASRAGALITVASDKTLNAFEWLDRQGRILNRIPVPPGLYSNPAISPDGRSVAYERLDSEGKQDIWVLDLERNLPARITNEPGDPESPVWSPDGSYITYAAIRGGSMNIYRKPVAGGPEEALFTLPGIFNEPRCWTADGTRLLIRSLRPETGEDILLGTVGGEVVPFLASSSQEMDPNLSPDGRWLLYRSSESGRSELYVQSFPDPDVRRRISTSGAGSQTAQQPIWSPDGRAVYYLSADNVTILQAGIRTEPELAISPPTKLFELPTGFLQFDSRDGERFLTLVPLEGNLPVHLNVVTDWTEVLRRER